MPQLWSRSAPSEHGDDAICRRMIRNGSKSFHAASLLLPPRLRDASYALYAFCRVSDDAVDEAGTEQWAAVAELRERLDAIYAGNPMPFPSDRAFAGVIDRHHIPRELPEALIDGFAWDAEGRQYEDISELRAYAARVASAVGTMMCLIMDVRQPRVLARACDLGVAMQLTNIARDVGEDARNGRLYLPRRWMRDVGLDPDVWLADPRFCPEIGAVTQRLLHCADDLYARAATGIEGLPAPCRPAIHAAGIIYAEIGREVERAGCDSVSRRACVPARRKMQLAMKALRAAMRKKGVEASQPLPETRYLVEAVVRATLPAHLVDPMGARRRVEIPGGPLPVPDLPWWRYGQRVVWVVDLMLDLEQRRQHQALAIVKD